MAVLLSAFHPQTPVRELLRCWRGSTHSIGQLRLSHQILGLGSDQLLLQRDELDVLRLLDLQPGNFVGNLSLVVPTGLHALLGIADLLQDVPGIVHGVGIVILLLTHLGQDNTDFVADVVDSVVVCLLAPLGQLGANGDALAAGRLVRRDDIVGGLDKLIEPAGQLGLDGAAEGV